MGPSGQHRSQEKLLQIWPAAYRLTGRTTNGSYLLGLRVLGAGGGGLQTPAGELPSGTHCACSDITLRVLEELAGKCGHFRGMQYLSEISLP